MSCVLQVGAQPVEGFQQFLEAEGDAVIGAVDRHRQVA